MRERFICVRITGMNGINLRRFEFDYDTTWNAFFLDAKLNVYSRYGGRDEGEPEARMSKASLLQTMREVLAVHSVCNKLPQPRRKRHWQPVPAGVSRPADIPLLKKSHQGCVHCHQIREYRFLQWAHDKTFSRRRLFNWPLPENVGLVLDRRHGHRIAKVPGHSAAARVGLRTGDVVTRINGTPIHSEYDIRWALGRTKPDAAIRVTVDRKSPRGKATTRTVDLHPAAGWRETELGWRKSMRSLPLQFGFRGYSLTRSQRKPLGIAENRLAIRIVSVKTTGLAGELGLRKKDVIIAVGQLSANRTLAELKSDLLRRHRPGSTVRMTVLRGETKTTLSGRFPNWHTEESSVP